MRRIVLLLTLGLAVPLSPCAAAELVDATGRTVVVPDEVHHVLPAGPPAAVLLAALAPDLMIGWPHAPEGPAAELLPPELTRLPVVPMMTAGRDETPAAVALHPDLILDYGSVGARYKELAEKTQAATGIPTVLLDAGSPIPRWPCASSDAPSIASNAARNSPASRRASWRAWGPTASRSGSSTSGVRTKSARRPGARTARHSSSRLDPARPRRETPASRRAAASGQSPSRTSPRSIRTSRFSPIPPCARRSPRRLSGGPCARSGRSTLGSRRPRRSAGSSRAVAEPPARPRMAVGRRTACRRRAARRRVRRDGLVRPRTATPAQIQDLRASLEPLVP